MIESQDKAVELFYEQSGRGFPVFLIHGYPLDHTIWRRVIPLVKSEARIITPDLRGFGQSPVPEGVYTMQLMAEDLARLMDRLEIQRAALIGHSMGGYVTLPLLRLSQTGWQGLDWSPARPRPTARRRVKTVIRPPRRWPYTGCRWSPMQCRQS